MDAISLVDGRAIISAACRGCGRCVKVCPIGAIELTIDGTASVQQTIERINTLVDVS